MIRHAHTLDDPQSYGMPAFEYEGTYLGLLRSYKNPGDETIDVQLTISHDNLAWQRVADEATFFPVGQSGQWDDGMVFVAPPVIREDVMEFYYGGWDGPHDSSSPSAAIGLATLPRDRFAAISATGSVASLQTTKFTLEGERLTLNADATEGQIRVALLEGNGEVIPGFGLDDCTPITPDVLRQPLMWGGSSDLSPLTGTEMSLLFEIQAGAELFAFHEVDTLDLLGDFNKDGLVTTADFDVMKAKWHSTGNAFNQNGEVTGDGVVDIYDFKEFKEHLFPGGAAALVGAVPEPCTFAFLLEAIQILLWLRFRSGRNGALDELAAYRHCRT